MGDGPNGTRRQPGVIYSTPRQQAGGVQPRQAAPARQGTTPRNTVPSDPLFGGDNVAKGVGNIAESIGGALDSLGDLLGPRPKPKGNKPGETPKARPSLPDPFARENLPPPPTTRSPFNYGQRPAQPARPGEVRPFLDVNPPPTEETAPRSNRRSPRIETPAPRRETPRSGPALEGRLSPADEAEEPPVSPPKRRQQTWGDVMRDNRNTELPAERTPKPQYEHPIYIVPADGSRRRPDPTPEPGLDEPGLDLGDGVDSSVQRRETWPKPNAGQPLDAADSPELNPPETQAPARRPSGGWHAPGRAPAATPIPKSADEEDLTPPAQSPRRRTSPDLETESPVIPQRPQKRGRFHIAPSPGRPRQTRPRTASVGDEP